MPKSCSRWPDPTVDSETFAANVVDEDCDSDTGTVPRLRMQRGAQDSEKGLGSVTPLIERIPDDVTSTLEWRRRVLLSQKAYQPATTGSFHQQQTAEERWHTSLEIKIEQIRRDYREKERVLEREIVKLERRYEWVMEQLEREDDDDEEDYSVAERWEVGSDYQRTECGDDGSR